MKVLFVLLLLFNLVSCRTEGEKSSETFKEFYSGVETDVLASKNLNLVNQIFLADSRLLNHMESLFVRLNGQFIMETNEHKAHIEIFSYSNSRVLNGSFVRLSLNKDDRSAMDVRLFTGDNISVLICTIQNAVAFNGVFDLAIQFDNFMSGGRVSLWNLFISPENRVNLNFDLFNINTVSCTTQNRTSINRLGIGHRWGILTNYVKVHNVQRESPYAL